MSTSDPLQATGSEAVHKAAASNATTATSLQVKTQDPVTPGISPETARAPSMPARRLGGRDTSVVEWKSKVLTSLLNEAVERNSQQPHEPKGFLEWILSFFRSASTSASVKFLQKNHSLISDAVNDICQHMYQLDSKAVKDCIEALENSISRCKSELSPKVVKAYESAIAKMKGAQSFLAKLKLSPAGQLSLEECPKTVEAILRNGGADLVWRVEFKDEEGLRPSCRDETFKYDEVSLTVTDALFSDDSQERDAAVENFLANELHYFVKDGMRRCSIPRIQLPGRKVIDSNSKGGCDRTNYLKEILDKFKEAYGHGKDDNHPNALDAFWIFVQNFVGGNLFQCISDLLKKQTEGLMMAVVGCAHRDVTMTMDERGNITYEIILDPSTEKYRRGIKDLVGSGEVKLPPGYDEQTFAGVVVVKSEIPVAHNPSDGNVYKRYDQRGQKGKQTTEMFVAISYGDRSKLPAEA